LKTTIYEILAIWLLGSTVILDLILWKKRIENKKAWKSLTDEEKKELKKLYK
jgi:hypothetical protein